MSLKWASSHQVHDRRTEPDPATCLDHVWRSRDVSVALPDATCWVCERCGALRLQNPDDDLVGGGSSRLDPANGGSAERSGGGSSGGASARLEDRKGSGWYDNGPGPGHGRPQLADADGWTATYRSLDDPGRSTPDDGPPSSSPLLARPDPGKGPPRHTRWFVAAGVAAAAAVAVSASGAADAFFDKPDAGSSSPRAQSDTARLALSPSQPTPSMSPPASEADFSEQRALAKAADVTGDMENVDDCLRTGVDVNSALVLLSRSYGRLAEAGVPPGLDRSDYLARLTALQSLAAEAAEGYGVDRTAALATYSSVRDKTRVLFTQINRALGSHLSIP